MAQQMASVMKTAASPPGSDRPIQWPPRIDTLPHPWLRKLRAIQSQNTITSHGSFPRCVYMSKLRLRGQRALYVTFLYPASGEIERYRTRRR